MRKLLILILIPVSFSLWGQSKIIMVNNIAIQKLKNFKKKNKFDSDHLSFNGLSNPKLKTKLSQLLNECADDFVFTVKNNPSEEKFQEDIKKGLLKFNPYYLDLDTEDREKICSYFEEMMDCIELQSSGGQLNKWLYGFDPTKK